MDSFEKMHAFDFIKMLDYLLQSAKMGCVRVNNLRLEDTKWIKTIPSTT